MESEQVEQRPSEKQNVWTTVTPQSKYIAMTLFILLPFIGGYVGYTFAPVKVIEVEKIVERETVTPSEKSVLSDQPDTNTFNVDTKIYRNDELGVSFEYPDDWLVFGKDLIPERKIHTATYDFSESGLGERALVVHEDASDPTSVIIRTYTFGLDEALERWSGQGEVLEDVIINGEDVVKITDAISSNNRCTSIRYVHTLSSEKVGVVRVSGVCPSHLEEDDALKTKVAKSVRFLSNE